MTDEQIFENEIKCIIRRNEGICNGGSDCIKCDLLMDSEEIVKCYNRAIKNIDRINRQKAEIENLKVELKVMQRKEDELHRAKVEISKHFDYLDEAANEAIKEFAERLKEHSFVDNLSLDGKEIVYREDIDNLATEMTEAEK